MHFCMDEVLMILSALPFIGMAVRSSREKIHGWFHRKKGTPSKGLTRECPHDEDTHEH